MVGGMRDMLQRLTGENIELVFVCAEPLGEVAMDPVQMQQIIVNLVMNARDAMPNGGEIRIETSRARVAREDAERQGVRPGKYVKLTVEDTGCGMAEAVRARIFEPFFTTKKSGTGTGLGMSMVYGIVTHCGGAVSVTSAVGEGTRVTILLPQVSGAEVKQERTAAEPSRRGSETILVAEDNDSVRSSLAELLESRGYRVLQARDGLHAVQIAREHQEPIDLLLSDIVMPRLNGNQAAARIAQLHPEAKILLITGYPAKAADRAAVRGPLLFKPFSRAELAERVRATLEQRGPATSAAGVPVKGAS
jgi:CheY-like chemotaxis protein